ncbi:MAG: hypothetical protein GQ574_10380 [Crocinitomix sp.]|nr:hypothetical protein [Crocinitomix sp.]
MAINTPAQAVKYYLPFFVSNRLDLGAIKKELRTTHQFSDEDVLIASRSLSEAHVKHMAENTDTANAYFKLVLGGIIFLGGIGLTIFLLEKGFIAYVSFFAIGAGLLMIAQAIRNIRLNTK